MVACRYGISLFELNTPREISYLRVPMYYSLYIVIAFLYFYFIQVFNK